MRVLALLLALLAGHAHAACKSGVLAYYTTVAGALVDVCGNYGDLSVTGGTSPQVSTPINGFGPSAAAAKINLPSTLQSAMSSLTSYTIGFQANLNSAGGNVFPWSGQDSGLNYYFNFIGAGTPTFRWATEDGGSSFADSTVTASLGTTYNIWLSYNGTTKTIYVGTTYTATVVAVASNTHASALPAAGASMHFGAAWPPAAIFPTDGYVGNFLLMNTAITPPYDPIAPAAVTTGQRSPLWYNRQRNLQGPQIYPRLR